MKKKFAALLTAAVCILALAACGESGNAASGSSTAESSKAVSEASSASSAASAEASSASASEASSSASASSSEASSTEASSTEASSASSSSEASSASETSSTSEISIPEYTEEQKALLALPVVDKEVGLSECVELCDYSKVDVTDAYVEPTDADVQSYIDSQIVAVEIEDENAVVGDGDTANINYEGKMDGTAFEGGTGENYDLVIGSGTFIEGFEEGVTGMKAGETKDIALTFPEDYWNEEMAGKEVVFTVTLNSIKKMPEFNDEWVAKYSGTEETTVDGYKASVMEQLKQTAKDQAEQTEQMQMLQYVVDNSTVNQIPKSYVDAAEKDYDTQFDQMAQSYGMTVEELLEAAGYTEEYYEHDKAISSREAAKNFLIYDTLWENEKMTEDGEEYKNVMKDLEDNGIDLAQLEETYGEDYISRNVRIYSVLERLMNYANVVPAESTSASSAG